MNHTIQMNQKEETDISPTKQNMKVVWYLVSAWDATHKILHHIINLSQKKVNDM